MENTTEKRDALVISCEQLMTISCILAGFAFSGLIALPGMESILFQKIIDYFQGNFDLGFYYTFYFLFFSTICFLSTILTILVYKAGGYLIPIKKLRRIHLISNLIFSIAIATLLVSVITFGIPTFEGLIGGVLLGLAVAACFIWENLIPWQRQKRLQQLQVEHDEEATQKPGAM